MSRARDLSKLSSPSNFTVDTNNNIGVNSTSPDAKFDVVGIVSATKYFGDGSELTGITAGATLSAGSGDQKVVLTSKTAGQVMTTAGIDAELTYNSTSNTLSATTFSGNITGVAATFTGNVSVGGTLTYEDVTNIDSVGIITARSDVSIADKIIHTGDTNTAIRFPAADTFTVETAGSERLRVDSSGNLGINATALSGLLTLNKGNVTNAGKWSDSCIALHNPTNIGAYSQIGFGYAYSGSTPETYASAYMGFVSTNQSSKGYGDFVFGTRNVSTDSQPTERLRIDSAGRTLINTSSSIATEPDAQGYTPALQVVHAPSSAGTNGVSINRFQAGNAFAPPLIFQKSKNDTIGSHTIVANNDELGDISFAGSDGAAFRTAARINVDVDGTPGTSDMPGRIQFSTTADGAATPTERLRIDSSGRMLIGATAAVAGADANGLLQVSQDVGSNTCIIVAENTASSGNLSCFRARLRNSTPNSIYSAFLQCDDSSAGSKAVIRSNGGLANFSANNVNLSDRNVKKDITAAADTWNLIKNWEIVNFRYKEQPDDADLNLGVIAQQIEEISPEMVTIFQEAKESTETEPALEQRLGVKEQQMQWAVIKALQEAMARIETLETQNASLEARLTALETQS